MLPPPRGQNPKLQHHLRGRPPLLHHPLLLPLPGRESRKMTTSFSWTAVAISAPGFATDTTRTLLADPKARPHPKLTEIFTIGPQGDAGPPKRRSRGRHPRRLGWMPSPVPPSEQRGYDYRPRDRPRGGPLRPRRGHQPLHPLRPSHRVKPRPSVFRRARHLPPRPRRRAPRKRRPAPAPTPKNPALSSSLSPSPWIEFDEALLDRSLRSPPKKLQWFDSYQEPVPGTRPHLTNSMTGVNLY